MPVVVGRVWFWHCRCRLSSWACHEPIEIRPRPQHAVIIPQSFAVVALASVLSEPDADFARLHAHRCLPLSLAVINAPQSHAIVSDGRLMAVKGSRLRALLDPFLTTPARR